MGEEKGYTGEDYWRLEKRKDGSREIKAKGKRYRLLSVFHIHN